MSQFQFDATKVAPAGDRTPIPGGRYKLIVKSSELKPTQDNKGRLIQFSAQVLEGPIQVAGQPAPTVPSQAGKTLFFNVNIQAENPTATQIAQEKLSALCHAVQVLQINDTAQLHGRPFQAEVVVQKNDPRYNEINGFFYENGVSIVAQTANVSAGPVAPPAWAGAAQPTAPVPPTQPAPPSPVPTPAPVAPPVPTPAPPVQQAPAQQYHAASGGVNLPGTYTAEQVATLPQGVANVQVCPVGGNAWQPASSVVPAQQTQQPAAPVVPPATTSVPPAGTAALPPWMQQPPPQQ